VFLFKSGSIQMKVLWSRCTSHSFEPPWFKDQGKEVQTTFCKLHSRCSTWSQGGKQFFPRRPTHLRREVVRDCGSEALFKGKCREVERRGCCYSHYCSDQYISLLVDQKFFQWEGVIEIGSLNSLKVTHTL